jgi:hypothetical protein
MNAPILKGLKMEEVKVKYLRQVVATLEGMGCVFAIIDTDGNKYGKLQTTEPRKRQKSEHPPGTLLNHIRKHAKFPLQLGEVVCIPCGQFDPLRLQGSLMSHLCIKFGKGSYTSTGNKAAKMLEVMRVQ